MYSDNDPRENFLNNTFIKYIGFVDNFIIGLVIFDRNEPQRGFIRSCIVYKFLSIIINFN